MATEIPGRAGVRMLERGRTLVVAVGALILLTTARPACAAPKFLGPNKCASCHEHEKQKQWADKDTHAKALSQLEDKNAAKYAKAIGLADPYSLKGTCVSCHATIFNGDANAGVSCETCHGAGSDYVEPHQQKGAYAKAVTLGMIDTRGNLTIWAKMCVDCHILRDAKLIAAGHKSGADFDVGSSSQKIVHWAQSYDYAKLSAAGKAAGGRTAGAAAPKPAPAPAAAPTQAPTKPAPAATRAPTTASAAPAPPPTSTPVPAVKAAPAEVPRTTPPAPEKRPPPPPPPAEAKPTPRAGAIAIEIQATPIPTVTPRRAAPGAAAGRSAPPPRGSPRPAPRVKAKPRPRRTPAAASAPAPAPTRTPTRRPAPQLPPQRAPH